MTMKFYDTRFEEYVSTCAKSTFHPTLRTLFSKYPPHIADLKHVILYGPPGVGKYTQALSLIHKYSPSGLKYEKKMMVDYTSSSKQCQHVCKISDIHYEVDMSLLGCNAKPLWHEIHAHITDIVGGTSHKTGIIMCKNMQAIHSDLLEVLYSYMQCNHIAQPISLTYLFVSESVCFLPDNIVHCCEMVRVPRPRAPVVRKQVLTHYTEEDACASRFETSSNIKSLYAPHSQRQDTHTTIVQNIVTIITSGTEAVDFIAVRECLYELFVYDANVHNCIWIILSALIESGWITNKTVDEAMSITHAFFAMYNNNYRPIYHVESYLYKMMLLCDACRDDGTGAEMGTDTDIGIASI